MDYDINLCNDSSQILSLIIVMLPYNRFDFFMIIILYCRYICEVTGISLLRCPGVRMHYIVHKHVLNCESENCVNMQRQII